MPWNEIYYPHSMRNLSPEYGVKQSRSQTLAGEDYDKGKRSALL